MKAMFKKRLLKLAAVVEGKTVLTLRGKAVRFDMSRYLRRNDCGTAACIAGTAAILVDAGNANEWEAASVATKWLGLNPNEATQLFLPHEYNGSSDWSKITPRRASTVLRHFAETGEIKWNMKLS